MQASSSYLPDLHGYFVGIPQGQNYFSVPLLYRFRPYGESLDSLCSPFGPAYGCYSAALRFSLLAQKITKCMVSPSSATSGTTTDKAGLRQCIRARLSALHGRSALDEKPRLTVLEREPVSKTALVTRVAARQCAVYRHHVQTSQKPWGSTPGTAGYSWCRVAARPSSCEPTCWLKHMPPCWGAYVSSDHESRRLAGHCDTRPCA